MKIFWIFFLSVFFLGGCQKTNQTEFISNKHIVQKVPSFLVLKNEKKKEIGRAIPIGKNLFISPDHLLQQNPKLFWKEIPVEILVRDFENDILVFELKDQYWDGVQLSETPPEVGKRVFWFDGENVRESRVLGIGESFSVEHWANNSLLSIRGTAHFGDSGSLIFDDSGLVYGMLVGSDKVEQKSYAIRSDVLLRFLEENVEKF